MILENAKHEIFCRLVANRKTQTEAARDAGYSPERCSVTASDLMRRDDIRARILELKAELRAAGVPDAVDVVVASNLRERDQRVQQLQSRHDRLNQIIRERAGDPEAQSVPGGSTGLMRRHLRSVGVKDGQMASDWEIDVGLLKAMAEIEKQIAQEIGQWSEKSQVSVMRSMADYTQEELRWFIADCRARGIIPAAKVEPPSTE